jgi:hypothetical protein
LKEWLWGNKCHWKLSSALSQWYSWFWLVIITIYWLGTAVHCLLSL